MKHRYTYWIISLAIWARAARRIVWRRAVFIVPAGCSPEANFPRKEIPTWLLFWIAADFLSRRSRRVDEWLKRKSTHCAL
jgi:hypothetical protein